MARRDVPKPNASSARRRLRPARRRCRRHRSPSPRSQRGRRAAGPRRRGAWRRSPGPRRARPTARDTWAIWTKMTAVSGLEGLLEGRGVHVGPLDSTRVGNLAFFKSKCPACFVPNTSRQLGQTEHGPTASLPCGPTVGPIRPPRRRHRLRRTTGPRPPRSHRRGWPRRPSSRRRSLAPPPAAPRRAPVSKARGEKQDDLFAIKPKHVIIMPRNYEIGN